MLNARGDAGRSSPSFLIAMSVALLAISGYLGWHVLHPNQFRKSERIARQFAADAGKVVRGLRRTTRGILEGAEKGGSAAGQAQAAVDQAAAAAVEELENLRDLAQDALDALEDLPDRTLLNREKRLNKRLGETKARITEVVDEARGRLEEQGPR